MFRVVITGMTEGPLALLWKLEMPFLHENCDRKESDCAFNKT
jgi:hypothetical protein